jgi:hypothetical protein
LKKNLQKIATLILLVLFSSSAFLALASAKNLNLPEGADRIDYYNAGGHVDISLPTPLPTNFPTSATAMQLRFCHFETPNTKQSFDNLIIYIYMTYKGKTDWQPFAQITTSEESAAFERVFWKGTFMKFDLPSNPALSADNVIVVSEGTLTVDRHGNDVTVNLNKLQEAKIAGTMNTKITIPAFNLELNNYGESVHNVGQATMTFTGSSGYTIVHDEVGFKATGTFSTADTASVLNGASVQNAELWMHGSHTFYPPTI